MGGRPERPVAARDGRELTAVGSVLTGGGSSLQPALHRPHTRLKHDQSPANEDWPHAPPRRSRAAGVPRTPGFREPRTRSENDVS